MDIVDRSARRFKAAATRMPVPGPVKALGIMAGLALLSNWKAGCECLRANLLQLFQNVFPRFTRTALDATVRFPVSLPPLIKDLFPTTCRNRRSARGGRASRCTVVDWCERVATSDSTSPVPGAQGIASVILVSCISQKEKRVERQGELTQALRGGCRHAHDTMGSGGTACGLLQYRAAPTPGVSVRTSFPSSGGSSRRTPQSPLGHRGGKAG